MAKRSFKADSHNMHLILAAAAYKNVEKQRVRMSLFIVFRKKKLNLLIGAFGQILFVATGQSWTNHMAIWSHCSYPSFVTKIMAKKILKIIMHWKLFRVHSLFSQWRYTDKSNWCYVQILAQSITSVTILGDLLDFGQLFKAFDNN